MSACGCDRRRSGRVWFRYGDANRWDNIVSRRPAICWECLPANPGQQPCIAYNVSFTEIHTNGSDCIQRSRQNTLQAFGPIRVFLQGNPRPADGCPALRQTWWQWAVECRGQLFNGAGSCRSTLTTVTPGASVSRNIIRLENISITRIDGQPDNSGFTFRVWDQGSTLFSRTDVRCPQVRITCDDECPPGTEPFCGCCCNCRPLVTKARSIAEMIRGL